MTEPFRNRPSLRIGCVRRALGEAAPDNRVLKNSRSGLNDVARHRKSGGSVKQERIDKELNEFPVVLNVSALVLTRITVYPRIDDPDSRR
jgi:hypothetical protein